MTNYGEKVCPALDGENAVVRHTRELVEDIWGMQTVYAGSLKTIVTTLLVSPIGRLVPVKVILSPPMIFSDVEGEI